MPGQCIGETRERLIVVGMVVVAVVGTGVLVVAAAGVVEICAVVVVVVTVGLPVVGVFP